MSGWEDQNLYGDVQDNLRLFASMNKYSRNNANGEWHFIRNKRDNMLNKLGLSCAKLRIVELKIEDNKMLGLNENFGEIHFTEIHFYSQFYTQQF